MRESGGDVLACCLFVCLFCLFVCLFACLLVCLFACLLVCLLACLLACLFLVGCLLFVGCLCAFGESTWDLFGSTEHDGKRKKGTCFFGYVKTSRGGYMPSQNLCPKVPYLGSNSRGVCSNGKRTPVESPPLQETILKISGLSKSELAAFDANVHGPIESLGMFDVLQVPECCGKPSAFG